MRMLLSVVAVTLVAVAGYGGFRLAAGLDLAAQTGAGVAALAVLTGFAVVFSPCSFPRHRGRAPEQQCRRLLALVEAD
jgi:hypothetical protein